MESGLLGFGFWVLGLGSWVLGLSSFSVVPFWDFFWFDCCCCCVYDTRRYSRRFDSHEGVVSFYLGLSLLWGSFFFSWIVLCTIPGWALCWVGFFVGFRIALVGFVLVCEVFMHEFRSA